MKPGQITKLLTAANDGKAEAMEQLGAILYRELRQLAHANLRNERDGQTLRTTALVNEAFVRLLGNSAKFESRRQFFAFASKVMRNVLVDYARERKSQKRGAGRKVMPLDEVLESLEEKHVNVVELHEALEKLGEMDPRLARLVEMRFFAGMTTEEAAGQLEISLPTAVRDWRAAKAWLHRELS